MNRNLVAEIWDMYSFFFLHSEDNRYTLILQINSGSRRLFCHAHCSKTDPRFKKNHTERGIQKVSISAALGTEVVSKTQRKEQLIHLTTG